MKAVEGFGELGHLTVAFQAGEALAGIQNGNANPAADHRAVSSPRDASRRAPDGGHQVLDGEAEEPAGVLRGYLGDSSPMVEHGKRARSLFEADATRTEQVARFVEALEGPPSLMEGSWASAPPV